MSDFWFRKRCYCLFLNTENQTPLTCKNARISAFTSPRLLRQLPSKVHVFDYKSPKFYSHTYNTNEDIQSKLNRKPKFTLALCLSMCNDQISSPLYIEIRTNSARKTLNFAWFSRWNQATNIEGLLCNLSSMYVGSSYE